MSEISLLFSRNFLFLTEYLFYFKTMTFNSPRFFYRVAIIFLCISGLNFSSKACSPLNVPILVSQNIVGCNLNLQWNSTTPYWCPDVIDVEIACNGTPFSGLAAYTYTSSVV